MEENAVNDTLKRIETYVRQIHHLLFALALIVGAYVQHVWT